MLDHAVLRLLDSFFRHKLLCVLPLVLFAVLGGVYVSQQEPQYSTHGVLLVEDETLLSTLTGVRGAEDGWETPATTTSQQLNALLQTDTFVATIAERAGLGAAAELTDDDLETVRASVSVWEAGENLVHVRASSEDPALSTALAEATLTSLVQWQIDAEVDESTVAEGFLEPLTARAREDLADARAALEEYLDANPVAGDEARPANEQLAVDELTAEVADANARYADALGREESARLATAQAESDVRNRLQIVDTPETPTSPESRLKTSLVTLAAFLATGALLSAAAVVAGAVVDQSLRFPGELRRRLGVEILAVLPDAPPSGGDR